jgi:hypothetical protein
MGENRDKGKDVEEMELRKGDRPREGEKAKMESERQKQREIIRDQMHVQWR